MVSSSAKTTPRYLTDKKSIIDRFLDMSIPPGDSYPQKLHEAMRYSVLAGGKRIRPILAIAAFESCGGHGDWMYPAAAALELIHTYSLIHDDMPCMDDDDLRRGQPTVHKKFGEAVALLAGDALHDLAFLLLAQTGNPLVVEEVARAIGTDGMLAGQMADLEAEGKSLDVDEITFIHINKTGKLIRASARIGALLARADEASLEAISTYGEKVGLAFQIIDDILDIEGDTAILGKNVGSDSKNSKATYPGVVGLEKARQTATRLIDEAIACITEALPHTENFVDIAHFIAGRQN